jgi:hypothetical protein
MPGLTFAQLPEETAEFVRYLEGTGEVWACAVADDPTNRRWRPASLAEFLALHGEAVRRYAVVDIYCGPLQAIEHPAVYESEVEEGGTFVPATRDGAEVPGVQRRVGGHKVIRRSVRARETSVLRYSIGGPREAGEMALSNLSYYTGYFDPTHLYRNLPVEFTRWARNAIGWMRRRTAHRVPVHRANYEVHATAAAFQAHQQGTKFR